MWKSLVGSFFKIILTQKNAKKTETNSPKCLKQHSILHHACTTYSRAYSLLQLNPLRINTKPLIWRKNGNGKPYRYRKWNNRECGETEWFFIEEGVRDDKSLWFQFRPPLYQIHQSHQSKSTAYVDYLEIVLCSTVSIKRHVPEVDDPNYVSHHIIYYSLLYPFHVYRYLSDVHHRQRGSQRSRS